MRNGEKNPQAFYAPSLICANRSITHIRIRV
jgi:hypothetical protein